MNRDKHRIVVIGGGYVGTLAAVRAAGRVGRRGKVTLIDADGTFVQRLRLHQVATGQRVAAPELAKLCGRRVEQLLGRAESIQLAEGDVTVRGVDGSGTQVPYDSLIVATGSTVDMAATPGTAKHAHSLSDFGSSLRLAGALERAPEGARVAVVGGGLTGIEAATELAGARPDARVSLICREPFADWFSVAGRQHLVDTFDRLGVEVMDGVDIRAVADGALEPSEGRAMPFDLAVWCGGFVPRSLAAEGGLAVGERGGALVDRRMRSLSHPEVLVVGDAAECPPLPNGAGVRMSCQAGMPTGAHAADVVSAAIRGREEKDFDFGYIAWSISLGRRDGLIQWLDRADRPKDRVTRGRRAARIKAFATASAVKSPRWERRLPGALRWLASGKAPEDLRVPTPTLEPASRVSGPRGRGVSGRRGGANG